MTLTVGAGWCVQASSQSFAMFDLAVLKKKNLGAMWGPCGIERLWGHRGIGLGAIQGSMRDRFGRDLGLLRERCGSKFGSSRELFRVDAGSNLE